MNKLFYILNPFLLLLFLVSYQLHSKPKNKVDKNQSYFIGTIKLSKFSPNSGFNVYYNGQMFKVKGDNSSFKINLKKSKNYLNILFVDPENISFDADQNIVKSLTLKKLNDYKFFEIKNVEKDSFFDWQIKQSNLSPKNGTVLIPDDTIIIPLDPSDLKIIIENISVKKNSRVGRLPIIKIESKIEKSKLEEKMAKSCLSSMHLRLFHKKEELMDIKKSKNSKVSIII